MTDIPYDIIEYYTNNQDLSINELKLLINKDLGYRCKDAKRYIKKFRKKLK